MHTCSSWRASVEALTDLVPVATLSLPCLPLMQEDDSEAEEASISADDFTEALLEHANVSNLFVERAAAVPKLLARRVRLQGSDADAQGALVAATLMALPPNVFQLDLALFCSGPVLLALQRMPQLQEVAITGNGTGIFWEGSGAASALPKLGHLVLDYRHVWEHWQMGYRHFTNMGSPKPSVAASLGAATALHTLELRTAWACEAVCPHYLQRYQHCTHSGCTSMSVRPLMPTRWLLRWHACHATSASHWADRKSVG